MHKAKALFCVSASICLLVAARPAPAQVFHDDFDGNAIDHSQWDLAVGGGTFVVADGRATLSAPCPAGGQFAFPILTSKANPFPPVGDFVLRVGFRYVEVAGGGTGFGRDYSSPCGFGVWQDSAYHLRMVLGDLDPVYPPDPVFPDTGYHVYEWTVIGETWTGRVDGVLVGSDESTCRPDRMFFGHPHFITTCGWTSQEIDFVHIEPMGPTATVRPGWGNLKIRYR